MRPVRLDVTPVHPVHPPESPFLRLPEPITTLDARWVVLTPERALEAFLGPEWRALLTPEQVAQVAAAEWVMLGVTPQGYENMARSLADILRWVEESQWQLQQCHDRMASP